MELPAEISECLVCNKPLGYDSKSQDYPVCHEHRICAVCKETVSSAEARLCLTQEHEVMHSRCYVLWRKQQATGSPNENITISQSHFDYLNMCRLLIEPNKDLSPSGNEKDSACHTTRFVHQFSLDEQFLFMRRVQAIAAEMSLILSKSSREIKEFLKEQEQQQIKKAREVQPKVKAEVKPGEIKKSQTNNGTPVVIDASGKEHLCSTDAAAKALAAKLKQREKAILALTALGISRRDAEQSVDSQAKG